MKRRLLCCFLERPAKEAKLYVQHKMEEESQRIWSLLSFGAAVYIAGSSTKMPTDVMSCIEKIVAKEGVVPKDSAVRWLRALEKAGQEIEEELLKLQWLFFLILKVVVVVKNRVKCLNNCSCMAYTNSNIRGDGSGCVMWFKDLIDMRQLTGVGQDLYIRMAASELGECEKDDLEMPLFDLSTIATTTNNFSEDKSWEKVALVLYIRFHQFQSSGNGFLNHFEEIFAYDQKSRITTLDTTTLVV
ncbi:hypothetical protein IFM89_014142 [Coptis chinensis]|uniref:Apple domain-containing protein n=1 Tax=Coptis chinensis TaxID=261450 RepID=A0A835HUS3_9MAGN|nr:hypothetical protein IFM89_014142 [Coptis chinensis]